MKSTKTILAVALLIVGFSYVTHAYPPGGNSGSDCSTPQPGDFRSYFLPNATGSDNIIIPVVEGTNGFIVTDILSPIGVQIQQDSVTIFKTSGLAHMSFNTAGLPLVAGSTINILVEGPDNDFPVTLIGYVY